MLSSRLILPTVVLTIPGFAGIARLMRASLLQIMGEDFVRTARAKGLGRARVLAMTRYRAKLAPADAAIADDGTLRLTFDEAHRAVTPGQLVALLATGSRFALVSLVVGAVVLLVALRRALTPWRPRRIRTAVKILGTAPPPPSAPRRKAR